MRFIKSSRSPLLNRLRWQTTVGLKDWKKEAMPLMAWSHFLVITIARRRLVRARESSVEGTHDLLNAEFSKEPSSQGGGGFGLSLFLSFREPLLHFCQVVPN